MDETRFGYNSNFPDSFRKMFMWLCQDVVSLHDEWSFYIELFGNKENKEIMADMLHASSQIIEESVRNDMTMTICRLSDPHKSSGKINLSFSTLVHRVGETAELSELLEDFQNACNPIQKHRNKRVAHNDLKTKIEPLENRLPGVTRQDIDRIVSLAEQILNTVSRRYDEVLRFESVHSGGAAVLIDYLNTVKTHFAQEKLRLLGNTI